MLQSPLHPSSSPACALDDLPVYSAPTNLPYSAELVRHIRRQQPVNQYDIVIDVTHFLSSSSASSSMKTTTTAASSSRQMRTTPLGETTQHPSSPPLSSSSAYVPEVFPQIPCPCPPESIIGSIDEQMLASPDLHRLCSRGVDGDSTFPGGGQLEYCEDREMDDWPGTDPSPSASPINTCSRHLDPSLHAIPLHCLATDHVTLDDRKQL